MFALLIGIDHYQSHDIPPLRGCKKDVRAVEKWLTNSYGLLEENKRVLLGKEANASKIRSYFRNDIINNDSIKKNAPIVIFFAGHGSRIRPSSAGGEYIELFCAYDHTRRPPKHVDVESRPICDYEMAVTLRDISSEKGNNITVILDCCHSGGAARGANNRTCETDESWREHLSNGRSSRREVGVSLPHGVWFCDWDTHVLLAACKANQSAGDSKEGGLFTCALLDRHKRVGRDVTYSTLMRNLNISTQDPQCVGTNIHRILFTPHKTGPLLIVGRGEGDDPISLPIGALHGITEQSSLKLRYRGSSLGEFVVGQVEATSCFLRPLTVATQSPRIGSSVGTKIHLYNNSKPITFYVD